MIVGECMNRLPMGKRQKVKGGRPLSTYRAARREHGKVVYRIVKRKQQEERNLRGDAYR